MKKSPLQQVRDEFGSKEALAEKLIPVLDRREEESDEDFSNRIKTASNKQLLRLWRVEERVKSDFGTRDSLLDKIVDLKFGNANAGYRTKLDGYTNARLVDVHRGLAAGK